jgi:hypothetical protein
VNTIEPDVDSLVDELYRFTLKDYWAPERLMVEQGYCGVKFPFKALPAPKFELSARWSLGQLEGYLRSWSATDKYIKDKGIDPVTALSVRLQQLWRGDSMLVTWPLALFARRKPT